MRKNTWCLLLFLALMTGCAISPTGRLTNLNGRYSYYAFLDERPYFAIVTDGKMTGGVNVVAHIYATYKGQISCSDNTTSILFRAKGQKINIGDQSYDLEEGRLLLVSTKNESFKIKQFKVSEEEKIIGLIASDKRMSSFFEQ